MLYLFIYLVLFVYIFFLPDTDIVMTLLQYFVCCRPYYSFLSVMKINVWHIIEQRTIDASIDQWHSRVKTRICAEGGHFKHMA